MNPQPLSRRSFFQTASTGLQGAALTSLLGRDLFGAELPHGAAAPAGDQGMNLLPKHTHIEPRATAVLDAGALHARAVAMDGRGKVLNYKMTSQCASGSGQFLENIARYLGVSQAEIGDLSLKADNPEKCSGICAVLAETDVINMVSRGISTENILRGIHESMAGRFTRLLRSLDYGEVIFMSGGLAGDVGLVKALADEFAGLKNLKGPVPEIATHPDSIFAGVIGAAIWGNFRYGKLGLNSLAWQAA